MASDKKPAMPENWDDIEGWNLYYEAYRQTGRHLDSSQIGYGWHDAEHFLASFIQTGWKKIWFPGCGISVGPQVYAALGFQVWASDASSTAIDILKGYQDNLFEHYFPLEPLIERYFSSEQEPPTPGILHLITHDFRTAFPETDFDCVLNIRSFQGLPVESMSRAAQSHFEALRCDNIYHQCSRAAQRYD